MYEIKLKHKIIEIYLQRDFRRDLIFQGRSY